MEQKSNTQSALEAILFTSGEAIKLNKLAEILETNTAEVETELKNLQKQYEDSNSGIVIKQIAGGWRMFSSPQFSEIIKKYIISLDTRKLSNAALETLSIIAYTQPVTRSGVASARGVNSDSSINSLIEKGLIKEAGTAAVPGNPTVYATTDVFLEHFGLNSVYDLPSLDQFAADENTINMIRERLSSSRLREDQTLIDVDENADSSDKSDNTSQSPDGSAAPDKESDSANQSQNLSDGESAASDKDDEDPKNMFETALSSAMGVTDKVNVDELIIDTDNE